MNIDPGKRPLETGQAATGRLDHGVDQGPGVIGEQNGSAPSEFPSGPFLKGSPSARALATGGHAIFFEYGETARVQRRAGHRRIGTLEDDDLEEGGALSPMHETECAVRSRIYIKTA